MSWLSRVAWSQVDDGCPLWLWRGSLEVDAPQQELLQRLLREQELWVGNLRQAAVVETLAPTPTSTSSGAEATTWTLDLHGSICCSGKETHWDFRSSQDPASSHPRHQSETVLSLENETTQPQTPPLGAGFICEPCQDLAAGPVLRAPLPVVRVHGSSPGAGGGDQGPCSLLSLPAGAHRSQEDAADACVSNRHWVRTETFNTNPVQRDVSVWLCSFAPGIGRCSGTAK